MKRIYQLSKGTVALVATVLCLFAFSARSNAQFLCGAGFSYAVSPGGVVTFYDSSYVSGGTVTSASWSFGDGTSGTGTQITHTYNGTGPYTVCYAISTSNGCFDSVCVLISLTPCSLNTTVSFDSIANTLTANATGGTAPFAYLWSNGSNSSTITPGASGTYCVTITDANGCYDNACYTIGGAACSAFYTYGQNPATGTFTFYGSFGGSYASVLWDFGDGSTSTIATPSHTYSNPGTYTVCVSTITFLGTVCSTYCNSVVVASTSASSVICGNIFSDLNANGILDGSEIGLAGQTVYMYGNGMQVSAVADSNGHFTMNVFPGTYFIYYCTSFPNSLTVRTDSGGCGFYSISIGANDTICGNDFGVSTNNTIITGTVFIDGNTNGILDAGEYGIPYQAIQIGTTWTYTDGNGFFSCYKPTGTYNVTYTPSGSYAPYSLTTSGSISVAASTAGNTYGNNNFGLNIPPGTVNLNVNLNPHTTVTPGFPAWYDVQVCNQGVMPVASTLTMIYDPGLTLNWASPSPASNNVLTHTLTWNLATLAPGNCDYIWVDFDADAALVLGTNTIESAYVTPVSGTDIDMSNNLDTIHQIVVGSWDPNSKLAVQTNYNDPAYQVVSSVNPDQSIEYTINFQNEGTAAAQNIVVVDQLSNDVDWSTFELTSTSHNALVSRIGNTVTYKFIGIMLPDATTNEPLSHGYVSYRVKANNGLPVGHQISDFSNIYFDFNSPVTTNNAVITLIMPNGIDDSKTQATILNSYPNPVGSQSTLQFDLKSNADVSIDVRDASGRVVLSLLNSKLNSGVQKVDLNASQLANGIYTICLSVDGKSSFTKISVSR